MKNIFTFALIAFAFSSTAMAQSNKASQEVSIRVAEIAVISVQGTINMTIASATAGQAPDAATASATYAITTNGREQKISAKLDSDMPEGLTLFATMAAPSKASSNGKVRLSERSSDLVKKISRTNESGLALNYEAVATVDARPDNVTRTVTYTITED
ncbi:hypothetical protein HQ496_13360 [bacterium]|nr:hypothetical protein [bacterium]